MSPCCGSHTAYVSFSVNMPSPFMRVGYMESPMHCTGSNRKVRMHIATAMSVNRFIMKSLFVARL